MNPKSINYFFFSLATTPQTPNKPSPKAGENSKGTGVTPVMPSM